MNVAFNLIANCQETILIFTLLIGIPVLSRNAFIPPFTVMSLLLCIAFLLKSTSLDAKKAKDIFLPFCQS